MSPGQIRFPAVAATSRSGPRIVTLTNRSGSALTVDAVVSGDFSLDAPSFPQTLNPNASMAVAVSFMPRQDGAASGALTIWTVSKLTLNPTAQKVSLSGATPCFWQSDLFIAFLLCPLYWFAMVIVRWHRVARTTRELLRAQINSLGNEVNRPTADPVGAARIPGLIGLLDNAKALLDLPHYQWGRRLANVLFWSRGQEMTGWGYVHEVEVQMIPCLEDETVTAKLETVERKLRATDDTPCVALANVIHQALSPPPAALPRRRALLAEALAANYSREDNQYADLVSWQNKTSWLVVCGLILILALTGAYPGHSILLLIGATGGLLSRLSRSLDRKSVPTDYGASWTTLFLSPVAGALAAWTGILIADVASRAGILGANFNADWSSPLGPRTLAIALLFGFSERLLDSVLDKLEGKATGTQTQPRKQQAPAPPPLNAPAAGTVPTALTITTSTLPPGQLNQPYAQVLAAANAVGTVTWSLTQGPLPDGLHLGGDGKLTGVPTKQGTSSFTVTAADQKTTAHQVLTVTVA